MSKKPKRLFYLATGVALLAAVWYFGYHYWYLDRFFERIEKDQSGQPVKMKLGKIDDSPARDIVVNHSAELTLTNLSLSSLILNEGNGDISTTALLPDGRMKYIQATGIRKLFIKME